MSIDLRKDYGRNYIINGNFDIWQRGTSTNSADFLADRWLLANSSAATTTYERSTDIPNNESAYSLKHTTNTAAGAPGAGQFLAYQYSIEGYDFQAITGKLITLSFYVKSSVAGTYCVSFRNQDFTRSYVTEYTINQPNTWERKTITLLHDPTGVWNYLSDPGLRLLFSLTSGSNFETNTPNEWQSSNLITTPNQTDLANVAGATWQLSQVQILEGSQDLPFRRAGTTFSGELELCKYYFESLTDFSSALLCTGQATSTSSAYFLLRYSEKRTLPTISASANTDFNMTQPGGGALAINSIGATRIRTKSAQITATTPTALFFAGQATSIVTTNTNARFDINAELN